MNIISAHIDWAVGWCNQPELCLFVDDTPNWDECRFEERNGCYLAIDSSGYSTWIYKENPAVPDNGYGGSGWKVTMIDGTVRTWRGGWSSRSHVMNTEFPDKGGVMECCYYNPKYSCGVGGGITFGKALEMIKQFNLPATIHSFMEQGGIKYKIGIRNMPYKTDDNVGLYDKWAIDNKVPTIAQWYAKSRQQFLELETAKL